MLDLAGPPRSPGAVIIYSALRARRQMKEQIVESAKFLGLKEDQPIESFFDGLTKVLDSLEERLDDPNSWDEVDDEED